MWLFRWLRLKWGGIWLIWAGLWGQTRLSYDTLLPPGVGVLPLPAGGFFPGKVEASPPVDWRYDTLEHALRWTALQETLHLRFQLYLLPQAMPKFRPLPLSQLERWDSAARSSYVPALVPGASEDTFVPQIQRSGSLVRSLTVGTGQNATLNSSFRLNLEGKIAPDLYLLAALTDENLPFQTATTQTLSDFDRVNIGLRWRETRILLGDLELRESRSSFANFYRNVLGVEVRTPLFRGHGARVAFAEAKGQFHTNSFVGQEGRQGPYPLTGKNGERFIPILAGSEKVYVNGVLMRRGQDQDYVIDYALGELTFTPRVPITAATRIVVDFEYADRSYGRSFLWLEEEGKGKHGNYSFSYFRQADNPRRPLDFSLSPEEEAFLAELPPGQTLALLPGVDTLPYDPTAIRYAIRDTLLGGETIRYFVFSRDSTQAKYQVSFVYAGSGKGDYVREPSSVNGNIFRWVGPGLGDYRVGRAVPLPTAVEVFSFRHALPISQRLRWEGETDISRFSENRFAGRYKGGVAARHTLRWEAFPDSSSWRWSPSLSLQYVQAAYQNADRVYEREYGRKWNYNDAGARATERLVEVQLPLSWRGRYRLSPQGGWRSWGDTLRTLRSALLWEGLDSTRGVGGQYLGEYLFTEGPEGADRWLRHTGKVFYTWGRWRVGSALWTEKRQTPHGDSLNFRFHEYTPFLRYGDARWRLQVAYQWRREWQKHPESAGGELLRFRAYMPQAEAAYQGERWSFSTTASYRVFLPGDTVFRLEAKRTLLSQNTFRLRILPWEVEAFYQVSAEQTPQRQLLYVAVNPGQGTHEWRDLNGDGLQQIEEFFPAVNPLLANYIVVQRPTGRFIPAVGVGAALALRYQPQKRLRWLAYQANTRLDQKQNAPDNRLSRFLPSPPPTDTTFVQWSLLHRQDLFLFRSATRGDQTFSFQYNLSQRMPLSGLQRQTLTQYTSRTRYNFSPKVGAELVLTYLRKRSEAFAQADLNYSHQGIEVTPQIAYQPTSRWRTTLGVAYRDRVAFAPQKLSLRGIRVPMEQRWSWRAGAFVGFRLEPAWYTAPNDLPPLLSFDLLEGMQRGKNLFASATINFPLNRFIELSLLYEGRFTAQKPVHSARMQARANF
uniref:Hypothetical conserved protein n=1 Tax=uncultured Bacteroidota bacterium TaxID=152509 RepID=H5SIG3_9BACT|nr:hypothetical conserved protein [uncultured Bacteroidetes bacterium]